MQKVVMAQATDEAILSRLRAHADVSVIVNNDPAALLEACRDAVGLQVGTWVRITDAFLAACPALRVVSRTGVGVDNLDVDAASRRGVLVLNTPQANALSVAEHTLALLMALAKQLAPLDAGTRTGNFEIRRKHLPIDLDGKTLGLIGFGSIGRLVAKKANAAFSMDVLAYDPYVKNAEPYVRFGKSCEQVVSESDAISIHLPLLPQTRNLFNTALIANIKPTAFLINTSRGGIVDESALCAALNAGEIRGAALDVFESEPPKPDSPVLTARNLLLTPHAAALTQECVVRVAQTAAEGILDYLEGRIPKFVFNANALGL